MFPLKLCSTKRPRGPRGQPQFQRNVSGCGAGREQTVLLRPPHTNAMVLMSSVSLCVTILATAHYMDEVQHLQKRDTMSQI